MAEASVGAGPTRLQRIRNWQSEEFYAALVIRPIAILVMLVIADWRWLTPNMLTTLANASKLAASWFILTPSTWWLAAVLLQLGLLFDHLDGTVARYRQRGSVFGSYYDKVSDGVTWAIVAAALGWAAWKQTGDPVLLLLASVSPLALLVRGYAKWVQEYEMLRDRHRRGVPFVAPATSHLPPERTPAQWATWFVVRVRNILSFAEVDLFFWVGLGLVLGELRWLIYLLAVSQIVGMVVMIVQRGWQLRAVDRSA